jgi:thymidylate synthase ThyX
MKEMKERTALGEAILRHWREHCPQMVRDLEKENRLDQAVFETQERTGDLLYELVSVKKMDYQAAWELAREEWALPQSEDQSGNLPPAETSPSGTSRPEKAK